MSGGPCTWVDRGGTFTDVVYWDGAGRPTARKVRSDQAIVGDLANAAKTPGTSGIWVDEPHRAIGAALVYFLFMAGIELWLSFKSAEGDGDD